MIDPYKCKKFKLEELLDKLTFTTLKNSDQLWKGWSKFDDRLLKLIDLLRIKLNKSITINDWLWNGKRQWSGYRPYGTPYYSEWSQHSSGQAIDILVKGMSAVDVREFIKALIELGDLESIGIYSITCEETKSYRDNGKNPLTWVHISIQNNRPGYNEFYV